MSPFETGRPAGEPIAVIGIGCRLPGADNPDELWANLCAGRASISTVPPDRFDVDAYYDDGPARTGRIYTRYGGFLDRIDEFDAGAFGVAPREAEQMDPQQRILLEVAHEAFDDAGIPVDGLAGGDTAVFVGQFASDYWDLVNRQPEPNIYATTGTTRSITAGRLSYALDLRGPSVSVDAACGSSLVAVHLACQSLRTGEASLALAAGTNLVLGPEMTLSFCQANMLSRDGRCKFGAAGADGFVRSDGVAAVVLKPLAQAEADGDDIYAVILGSAVRNDGQTSGYLLMPGAEGQAETLRQAYRNAGVSPGAVGYVEAHGTGTAVGDRTELTALAEVLAEGRDPDRPCRIGSVKTNLGHTEATAGLAGLIKAVLCLRHGFLPPSLHAEELTGEVDWDAMPVVLQREPAAWPDGDGPRLAGVSSFGFSGTNAHAVLAEYVPAPDAGEDAEPADPAAPVLLPLSAHGTDGLRARAAGLAAFLRPGGTGRDLPLAEVARTAAVRRTHLDARLAVVATGHDELAAALAAAAANDAAGPPIAADVLDEPVRVVFVFPGQGSQWVGMGRELLRTSPVFRDALRECDAAVRAETGWSVIERIDGDEPLTDIAVIQPTLWAMEVALAALWQSWGVRPDIVVGHSMGEAAAACVAGVLSVADAAAVICRRSALLRRVAGNGAMLSVDLSMEQAEKEIAEVADRVSVAVSNGPGSTVLSGDAGVLAEIAARLDERDVFCRPIKVDVASHSPQMDPLREPLHEALAEVRPRAGTVPVHSTVAGQLVDGETMTAGYWVRNLREPVQFGAAVASLARAGRTLFVEISPHPLLLLAVDATLAEAGPDAGLAVGSLRRDQPERATLLESVAAMYRAGVPIDWRAVSGAPRRPVHLPAYPWQRRPFWHNTISPAARPVDGRRHPLLGGRLPGAGAELCWEGPLDLAANGYLVDHQVQDTVVVPGVAYVEMVLAAVREISAARVHLADVAYQRALFARPGAEPLVRVSLTRHADGWRFALLSRHPADPADQPMAVHATGSVRVGPAPGPETPDETVDAVRERCTDEVDGADFYARSAASGNRWGPAFQGIRRLWKRDGEALAEVVPAVPWDGTGDAELFHPALLDACAQVIGAVAPARRPGGGAEVFVLGSLGEAEILSRPAARMWSHAVRRPASRPDSFAADITVTDDAGRVLVRLRDVHGRYLEPAAPPEPAGPAPAPAAAAPEGTDWLYRVRWDEQPPAPGDLPDGPWLILADSAGVGAALAERLTAGGRSCVLVTAGTGWRRPAPDRYEIDPGSAEDHRRLVAALAAEADRPWRIVDLWAVDGPDLAAPDHRERHCVHSVLHLFAAVQALPVARLWLVTRATQAVLGTEPAFCPEGAAVWGLGRTAARETPASVCTLIDLPADAGPDAAAALAGFLASGDPEQELALRAGRRYAARLVRAGDTAVAALPAEAAELRFAAPGVLDSAHFAPLPAAPLPPDQVEIRVEHLPVNYRDVLFAMGAAPGQTDMAAGLGWECTGVLTAVGADVAGLAVGDEVVAMADRAMRTVVRTPATMVFRRPAGLTSAEAATIPVAYVTAYRALVEVARLRAGERVLIHAATGGVGMAAVQVARWIGAEIYATAGSPAKRALLRVMGVQHIGDSRSLDFADQFREATRGRGIDVVLNMLSGGAVAAGVGLLAPYGRYVELTKRDLVDGTPIDPRPLIRNLSFAVVDVADMIRSRPDQAGEILGRVLRHVAAGEFPPLPFTAFPATDVAGAFRLMAQARQTGRVLLDLAGAAPARGSAPPVAADATYVISGGLGDLGLVAARWLADHGARELLLLGRTPLPPGDPRAAVVRALAARGVRVDHAAVDVADEEAVRAVLAGRADRPPVRGVIHAAGVLRYRMVEETSPEELAALLRPKLAGGRALRAALDGAPLDFFVLYSSGSVLLASPLLGAYAAANAALDALARQWRSEGVPALAVNWGFWEQVGMAARDGREQGRGLAPGGIRGFAPEQGMRVLETLLARDETQVMVMPADWRQWARAYPEAAAAPLLTELVDPPAAPEPVAETPAPPPAPARETAPAPEPEPVAAASGLGDPVRYLAGQVAAVLGLPESQVSPRRPLNRQGMDSLMAVAVRNRVKAELGVTLPIARLLGDQNLAELAGELERLVTGSGTAAR